MAGVLGASGVDIDPVTLTPQVFLPGRQGSLQIELLAATRRAGRDIVIRVVADQDGKRRLITRDAQHEYVFTEEAAAATS